MAKKPNTLNLLAKLRREHEFWELHRAFTHYYCRIWEYGNTFEGSGELMGEAIQGALEKVKSWREGVGQRRGKETTK